MNARVLSLTLGATAALILLGFQIHRFFAVEDDAGVVRDFFVDEETMAFERHTTREIPPLTGRAGRPTVVIARCFVDADGVQTISWLERFPDDVKQQLEEAWSKGEIPPELAMGSTFKKEVRRPEPDSPWIPVTDPRSKDICVPPSATAQPAFPR